MRLARTPVASASVATHHQRRCNDQKVLEDVLPFHSGELGDPSGLEGHFGEQDQRHKGADAILVSIVRGA